MLTSRNIFVAGKRSHCVLGVRSTRQVGYQGHLKLSSKLLQAGVRWQVHQLLHVRKLPNMGTGHSQRLGSIEALALVEHLLPSRPCANLAEIAVMLNVVGHNRHLNFWGLWRMIPAPIEEDVQLRFF